MKRKYETVIIFDGSLPDETVKKEQEKVENFLKENTDYEKTDVWGKRTLAYNIKKRKIGFYCFFIFDSEGDIADKLHQLFKLNQNILRYMTVLYKEMAKISKETVVKKVRIEEGDE